MDESQQHAFTRADDLPRHQITQWGSAPSELLGTWNNCHKETGQIHALEIHKKDHVFHMRIWGAHKPDPIDWGTVECGLYASAVDSSIIEGLTGFYDFGFMETSVAANVKYGVLVIQTFNTFKDNSPRSNYFAREFFYQKHREA